MPASEPTFSAPAPAPDAPTPPPPPPRAARRPVELRHHDDVRVDPWYWLRDSDDPEVLAYLEAENAYADVLLAPEAPLVERVFEEIKGRVQETDESAPIAYGPWEYFSRTFEGRQYSEHHRRPRRTPGVTAPPVTPPETLLLDENALAGDSPYFALGGFAPSPSHDLLAYSIDLDGSERYRLHIRDLARGMTLDDTIDGVYYGLAWANDENLFYVLPDESVRPFQVWHHIVGHPTESDTLVFEESDERFFVALGRSRSGRCLVIASESKTTSEVHLLSTADPSGAPRVVEPRLAGREYGVEHHVAPDGTESLLVLTNTDGAQDFALYVAPMDAPGRAHWTEVIGHRPGVRLEDVDAFTGHLVLSERADGLERLRVLALDSSGAIASGADNHVVAMPDPVHSVWLGDNPESDTTRVRIGYTSLVRPTSAYDYDLDTRELALVKAQPVLGGYDPDAYVSERRWAVADDGVRIPISLVRRRDIPAGPAPCVLYGYGSYEHSIEPAFSSPRVSLLDRGVVYAVAHVRGGGEMGRTWYEQGRLRHKRTTFTDFVACAEALVADGVTTPERLAARGGSAGGLLMGAVTNLRPDLFRAVVAEVPFVDCLTTMLDPSLPLTVTEWEEWGDPLHDLAVYEYMKSYSPYDNVAAVDHPALYVTAGLNDPRVSYWEPAKWVAKLRAMSPETRPILLRTEMGAGHGGPSGRYDAWRDEARVFAFLLSQLDADQFDADRLEGRGTTDPSPTSFSSVT